MSLRKERNEQNEQAWHAHFEQGRRDLSASVEAALMDDGVLTQQWLYESDEQDASQPSGILARLAQRFTSSFVAMKPEIPQQQMSPYERSFSQDREAYPATLPANSQLPMPALQPDMPLVRVIDTVIPSDGREERTDTGSQKPHALKRNAKVRLETTEQPAIAKAMPSPQREEQETGEALLADVRDALSQHQIPSVPAVQREQQSTLLYSALRSAPASFLSGSGAFESEQSDVMIVNAHITTSSVVLVTLTTNPGPVVVQYISLQPEVGFTVHLTAPVMMRTTFNYAIVLGETV